MANAKHIKGQDDTRAASTEASGRHTSGGKHACGDRRTAVIAAVIVVAIVAVLAVVLGGLGSSSVLSSGSEQAIVTEGSDAASGQASGSAAADAEESGSSSAAAAAGGESSAEDSSAEDAASERLSADPSKTFTEQADFAALSYPQRWKDVCRIETDKSSARYYATVRPDEEVLLFTVSSQPIDGGSLLGSLDGQDLYLKTEEPSFGKDWQEYEKSEVLAMLEDVNVLIDGLTATPGFTATDN